MKTKLKKKAASRDKKWLTSKRTKLKSKKTKGKKGTGLKLKAVLHPAEEGGFWAEVPALPGCVSEGDTLDETLANIREAAEGWLEVATEQAAADPSAQVVEVEV